MRGGFSCRQAGGETALPPFACSPGNVGAGPSDRNIFTRAGLGLVRLPRQLEKLPLPDSRAVTPSKYPEWASWTTCTDKCRQFQPARWNIDPRTRRRGPGTSSRTSGRSRTHRASCKSGRGCSCSAAGGTHVLPYRAGLSGEEALREAVAGFWRTYANRRGELIGIFQTCRSMTPGPLDAVAIAWVKAIYWRAERA